MWQTAFLEVIQNVKKVRRNKGLRLIKNSNILRKSIFFTCSFSSMPCLHIIFVCPTLFWTEQIFELDFHSQKFQVSLNEWLHAFLLVWLHSLYTFVPLITLKRKENQNPTQRCDKFTTALFSYNGGDH